MQIPVTGPALEEGILIRPYIQRFLTRHMGRKVVAAAETLAPAKTVASTSGNTLMVAPGGDLQDAALLIESAHEGVIEFHTDAATALAFAMANGMSTSTAARKWVQETEYWLRVPCTLPDRRLIVTVAQILVAEELVARELSEFAGVEWSAPRSKLAPPPPATLYYRALSQSMVQHSTALADTQKRLDAYLEAQTGAQFVLAAATPTLDDLESDYLDFPEPLPDRRPASNLFAFTTRTDTAEEEKAPQVDAIPPAEPDLDEPSARNTPAITELSEASGEIDTPSAESQSALVQNAPDTPKVAPAEPLPELTTTPPSPEPQPDTADMPSDFSDFISETAWLLDELYLRSIQPGAASSGATPAAPLIDQSALARHALEKASLQAAIATTQGRLSWKVTAMFRRLERLSDSWFGTDLQKHRTLIYQSGYFDAAWYKKTYPDVGASFIAPLDHYLKYGASESRDPGPNFSSGRYLEDNPDVAASGENPLVHYLRHGITEGRLAHLSSKVTHG